MRKRVQFETSKQIGNAKTFLSACRRLGPVLVALALAAGCVAPQIQPGVIQAETELRNSVSGGKLIVEGGPVFALPGTLRMPNYFTGELAALAVRAERLGGGAFPRVAAASVGADGAFTLKGPITSELFFATTEFTAKDGLHRMRSLARAQSGEAIILDVASSLVGAKIALAAQVRKLDDLNYVDTTEVTNQVRSVLAISLNDVSLDQTNEQLSQALSERAKKSEALAVSLAKWESALRPTPAPSPSPKPSLSPTPSASESPQATTEPVK